MSAIFGVFQRDGAPASRAALQAMFADSSSQPFDRVDVWRGGSCGFGRALLTETPEAQHDSMPRWLPVERIAFAAEARIDDRDALCDALEIDQPERPLRSDSELLLRAYLRWGDRCPVRVLGDWSFAAWHPDERRLVLARDVLGQTSLFYHADAEQFVFASRLKALLDVPTVPKKLNELRVAKALIRWPELGDETHYDGIKRLLSGHIITLSPDRVACRAYWDGRAVGSTHFADDNDYAEGLCEVLGRAVRDRVRGLKKVGVALSGGLDSGAVAAEAALQLHGTACRLSAFSHVPLYPEHVAHPSGNERPRIMASAEAVGISDIDWIDSAGRNPIDGLRESLRMHPMPVNASGNQFWYHDLFGRAKARSINTVLVGAVGNATISWPGPEDAEFPAGDARTGPAALLAALLPPCWLAQIRTAKRVATLGRKRSRIRALNPQFARRLRLEQRLRDEGFDPSSPFGRDPRDGRLAFMRTISGGGGLALSHGIDVRDPTADRRVAEYCLSIPDEQYRSREGGRRWLVRRAMTGRLPDSVLSGGLSLGFQSADIARRLTDYSLDVESLLGQYERDNFVSGVIDIRVLRRIWLSRSCSMESYVQVVGVFLRALMVAMFLDTLGVGESAPAFVLRGDGD